MLLSEFKEFAKNVIFTTMVFHATYLLIRSQPVILPVGGWGAGRS
jgi:hypothetical protein